MEYLEPKELFETPEFYRNVSGFPQVGQMASDVKKESEELILTTEYTKSESIEGPVITFRKLKNRFDVETFSFGLFGGVGVSGVYIKGVIDWSDNTQSQFSTINNITYDNGVITVELEALGDRTPKSAVLRISQLQ